MLCFTVFCGPGLNEIMLSMPHHTQALRDVGSIS